MKKVIFIIVILAGCKGAPVMDTSLYEEMENDAKSCQWAEMEDKWRRKCAQLSGGEVAGLIAAVDMTDYTRRLEEQMRRAVAFAVKEGAKALYFEYDIDNDWDSNFFICTAYNPLGTGEDAWENEDWTCDWDKSVRGPSMPAFTRIYEEHGAFGSKGEDAAYYMILRTACAFAGCVAEMAETEFPICIGFHDQAIIWRVREPKPQ